MKIAIIGGTGKMGRWLARFLKNEGKEVILIGRNEARLAEAGAELGVATATDIAAAGSADAVIISVPIDSFEEVVASLSPHTSDGQIIMDITSVKAAPVAAMHRHIKKGTALGTHPVFGPGARGVANQNFVLTPTSPAEEVLAKRVKGFLAARGADVKLMTPAQHDEMMAVVLGLSHFIAIVAADSLLKLDKLTQLEAVSGTTYKVLLTLVESVLSEDPGLYASLQMNLPGLGDIEEVFLGSCLDWADMVKSGARQKFISRMEELKRRLEQGNPDFGKAYQNMYRIAEGR
jgi:prephenate dehydrogenase